MAKIKGVIRGDTHNITATLTGTDITGWTVFFTVKPSTYTSSTSDTDAVIQKTITSHTNPTSGITMVTLDPTDTADITPGTYYYDFQFKSTTGAITSTVPDQFIIIGDVTHRTT
jgi:hypothetical protein